MYALREERPLLPHS
jgi:hypothetical protein